MRDEGIVLCRVGCHQGYVKGALARERNHLLMSG